MPIWVATHNRHKVAEIAASLSGVAVTLRPLPSGTPAVVEDGRTFADNAEKKAVAVATLVGGWALADDSGLEVDALDGAPGIYSARFSGVDGADADSANNRLLLERLRGVPAEGRGARFCCVLALAHPVQPTRFFHGVVAGRIAEEERGSSGFGYDPLFYVPELSCTFGEVPMATKNRLSHRARALAVLRTALVQLIDASGPAGLN